jgi:hypothetical protein
VAFVTGAFLPAVIRSSNVLKGDAALTYITSGSKQYRTMGAKESMVKSTFFVKVFVTTDEVIASKVYPSGLARATNPCPSAAPAPGLLMTMIFCPRSFSASWAMIRIVTSTAPPAAKGTTILMGFVGKDSAAKLVDPQRPIKSNDKKTENLFFPFIFPASFFDAVHCDG